MAFVSGNKLNRLWQNHIKPIKDSVTGKLDASKIANNLVTTVAGMALDARQGKELKDEVDALNSNLFFNNNITIEFGTLPNNGQKEIEIPQSISTADWFILYGCAYNPSVPDGYAYPLPYVNPSNWNDSIGVSIAQNKIRIKTATTWTGYVARIVIAHKL